MGSRVGIRDFSVMTVLSRTTLRQYHDLGLLVPPHIDAHSGYWLYDTSQVDLACTIGRLSELGMSVADVKALLSSDDVAARNRIISAHLQRMDTDLQRTRGATNALRELLTNVPHHASIALRHERSTRVWAVTASMGIDELDSWLIVAMHQLQDAVRSSAVRAVGPPGCLFERELFAESCGEASVMIPVMGTHEPPARVDERMLPATDVAVLTRHGCDSRIGRNYGQLGTYVSEHLIGDEGPIREYYLGAAPTDFTTFQRTEICWPIFSTALE